MPEGAIRQRLACLTVGAVIAWPAAAQPADEAEPPIAAYILSVIHISEPTSPY